MLRPLLFVLCVLTILIVGSSAAEARTSVVAQKTSNGPISTIFLASSLLPHHAYRVDVISRSHQRFLGYGTETYSYVSNRQLRPGSASLTLNGTTPHTFSITSPQKSGMLGWILAVNVHLTGGRGLTVKFVDLGRKQ